MASRDRAPDYDRNAGADTAVHGEGEKKKKDQTAGSREEEERNRGLAEFSNSSKTRS